VDATKIAKEKRISQNSCVAVDVKSKQITGLEITDDKSHDSKCFISLVEQSKQFCNVTKILADGAYDTKKMILYICTMKILLQESRQERIHQ